MKSGPTYKPGDVILDVYVVERVLGTGGFNDVYLARHKFLPRKYAVKVLRESAARTTDEGERLRSRVEREAIVLAKFEHPNLPTLHDMRLDRGAPVLVLEYLRGQDLAQILDHMGQLSVQDALYVGIEVSKPLYIAHRRGIVHRDIKPENIFCSETEPPEGKAVLRLLDFGCSRFEADKRRLTRENAIIGTLYYIAPESLMNKSPDHRVDIYALGLVLYECLAGYHPLETDGQRIGPAEMARRHAHEPAPDVRERAPLTPPRLATLVDRMLKKHPGERIQSMEEVYDELWAILSSLKHDADAQGESLPSIFTKRGLELPSPQVAISSRRKARSSVRVDPGAFERTREMSPVELSLVEDPPTRVDDEASAEKPEPAPAPPENAKSTLAYAQTAESETPLDVRATEVVGAPTFDEDNEGSAPAETTQNDAPAAELPAATDPATITKIASRMRKLGNEEATPGARELLERGLEHGATEVRKEAASALAKVGGPISIGALDRALGKEGDVNVQPVIRRALEVLRFDEASRVFVDESGATANDPQTRTSPFWDDDPKELDAVRAGKLSRIALGAPTSSDRDEALLRLQSLGPRYADRVRLGVLVLEPSEEMGDLKLTERQRLTCLARLRSAGIDRFLLSVAVRAAVFGATDMVRMSALRILFEEGDGRYAGVLNRVRSTKGAVAIRQTALEAHAASMKRRNRALPEVLPMPDDALGETAPEVSPAAAPVIPKAPMTERMPTPSARKPLLRQRDVLAIVAAAAVVACVVGVLYLLGIR